MNKKISVRMRDTKALLKKLDIFARTCNRIMLSIKQSLEDISKSNLFSVPTWKENNARKRNN